VSNAAFLLIAVAGSIALSLLVWAFNRKPKTFMSSIDDFSREMKALGHDDDHGGRRRRRADHSSGRRSRPTAIDPTLTHPPAPPTRRDPARGPTVLSGPTGASSPTGPSGLSGPSGSSGASGPTSPSSGAPGPSGAPDPEERRP
jgi:hypothetical protein